MQSQPTFADPSGTLRYAHEMRPGECYAPLRFRITADINEQYVFALADYAPQYLGAHARAQVHPVLLLHMSARSRSPSWRLAPGMGSVFAKDRATFHRPAFIDEWLQVEWTIREVYERNGRLYQGLNTQVLNTGGDLVLERNAHSLFSVSPPSAPAAGV